MDSGAADDKRVLQTYGKTQYAQCNYADALTAFTTALSQGEDDKIGILNSRAATHCKLGNLDLALKDGRQMIEIGASDARGYLRTAQVLQLKRRLHDALRLYEYALKCVDARDTNRPKIELLKTKLDKVLNPPRRDPFAVLPPELVAMVLQYLNLRTLITLLRVSKRWAELVTSMGKAFSSMDLFLARRTIPLMAVRAYFRRHANTIEVATLERLSPQNATKTLTWLSRCPKINDVTLNNNLALPTDIRILHTFTGLKKLKIPKFPLSFMEFDSILTMVTTLECIDISAKAPEKLGDWSYCSRAPRLRALKITLDYISITRPFFLDSSLSDRMPALEELSILGDDAKILLHDLDTDLSGHPCLREFYITNVTLDAHIKALPKSLECLSMILVSSSRMPIHSYNFLEGLFNLKELYYHRSSYDIDYMLERYFSALEPRSTPILTTLGLSNCQASAGNLVPLMKKGHLCSITDLIISGIIGVDDSITEVMVDTMPNLKRLDMSGTIITGYSIKLLADAPNMKLEKMALHSTLNPINRDAYEYGKSKGITWEATITSKIPWLS
ncbi:hypothetical protein McanMca71_005555 [Microsporum canis]